MSKKKVVASLVALALLAAGGIEGAKQYREYQEGLPVLKGRCFSPGDGTGLAVPEVKEVMDDNGKKVQVYLGVLVMGPFQIPQLMKIRELNKVIKKALEEKKLAEVNCETGEPLNK